jgi:predicted transcriptional regulator
VDHSPTSLASDNTIWKQAMSDREQVAEIVSAYTKRNTLTPDQLLALIATVHGALTHIESGELPERPVLAMPIGRSVQPDVITCLGCGYRSKMLKRHLRTAHQLTPDEYRQRWGLKGDYPIVAPNYAVYRRELAKSFGLGNWRKRRQTDQTQRR